MHFNASKGLNGVFLDCSENDDHVLDFLKTFYRTVWQFKISYDVFLLMCFEKGKQTHFHKLKQIIHLLKMASTLPGFM